MSIPLLNLSLGSNEEKREIDVLQEEFVQQFVNDLRDSVKYDKRSSSALSSDVAATENTNIIP